MVEQDETVCSAADLYTAATTGGADALGRSDLGRLAPGAKADITVFDFTGFHLGQFIDPIQTMILSGSGCDFRTVIINGRIVMQDRQIAGVNLDEYRHRAQAQFDRLKARYPDYLAASISGGDFSTVLSVRLNGCESRNSKDSLINRDCSYGSHENKLRSWDSGSS